MIVDPGPGSAAGGRGNVRASSADRERLVDVINTAFAEGRLTMEEQLERVERAYTSRTHAELAALSVDLPPVPPRTLPSPAASAPAARRAVADSRRTNPLAIAATVCGLIPLLPATLAAIILGIAARRQIKRTGERGGALAATGLALGAAWLALTLIVLLALR